MADNKKCAYSCTVTYYDIHGDELMSFDCAPEDILFKGKCPTEDTEDMVNKPPHYNREGAMETIDEMKLIFGLDETMSYCKLNAWKYRARALHKNGEEDLKKSDWYLAKYQELKIIKDGSFMNPPIDSDDKELKANVNVNISKPWTPYHEMVENVEKEYNAIKKLCCDCKYENEGPMANHCFFCGPLSHDNWEAKNE